MGYSITNNSIDKYLGFLTRLDIVSKKKLIIKLTESIDNYENKPYDLKKLYGAWEDSRSSDEIINSIRLSRSEKTNTINF